MKVRSTLMMLAKFSLVIGAMVAPASAQTTATLVGTVKDTTRALIPLLKPKSDSGHLDVMLAHYGRARRQLTALHCAVDRPDHAGRRRHPPRPRRPSRQLVGLGQTRAFDDQTTRPRPRSTSGVGGLLAWIHAGLPAESRVPARRRGCGTDKTPTVKGDYGARPGHQGPDHR